MLPEGKDRQVIRAQAKAQDAQFDQEQEMLLVSLIEVKATEIITYDYIIKGIDKKLQHDSELKDKGKLFSFQDITDHLTIKVSSSIYEVLINWEDGHATLEPVSVMIRNYHIYLSNYARDKRLLDKPGWKQLRFYIKNDKKMIRLLKATKVKQRRNTVNIKFLMNISREQRQAMMFDFENGKNNWKDADTPK